jgi:hypothetical protein
MELLPVTAATDQPDAQYKERKRLTAVGTSGRSDWSRVRCCDSVGRRGSRLEVRRSH